ncbi:enolase C-terminal domain-like protein [Paenibacillus piri]|uniref:Mandelate racemase n=1 Tax=Paenibacillus piri TaxID=2547395 RepID=A0A4R5KYD1_9BACL|nr:enolase C-terminal domain-like protein [Paenibacillus piri]TDG00593.1 mandelate racemase [Paenibacillus piri]
MNFVQQLDPNWKIERIEQVVMTGERRRLAGCNARLGVHGKAVSFPMVRITIGGQTGFGWSRISRDAAAGLVGASVQDIFSDEQWIRDRFLSIQFPLLDWLGHTAGKPVYELLTGVRYDSPLLIPCYDTSLYFDDLHLQSEEDAVRLLQEEAMQGYNEGFRGFKIKVGRGAMHMELMEGTNRDIAIVNGIREAVGPECMIAIDANNGYNLGLTKYVLQQTASSNLTWLEEAFHEDREYYKNLKDWMAKHNLNVLIADGEGLAAGPLVDWAEQGLIDMVQYDLKDYGLVQWLALGARLDERGIKSAPHNYGGFYGNFASCHLSPAIRGFMYVEWDEAWITGIDTTGYSVRNGRIQVSAAPGFGLQVDEAYYARQVGDNGWTVR